MVGKCPATEGANMLPMSYNGANLLFDIVITVLVYIIGHGIGYRKGLNK